MPTNTFATKDHKTQFSRLRTASTRRDKYEKIVSSELVQLALRKKEPPAVDKEYELGDKVYVYREKLKHYTGPHTAASAHGKGIRLHIGERSGQRLFNKTQIRPAPIPNEIDNEP